MKQFFIAVTMLVFASVLAAQTSTVAAASIVGADNGRLQVGKIAFQPVDQYGNLLNANRGCGTGGLVVPKSAVCFISNGGITTALNGSMCTVVDTSCTNPAFCYKITIRDTVSGFTPPIMPCVAITGSTWSLDTYVPPAPAAPPSAGSGAASIPGLSSDGANGIIVGGAVTSSKFCIGTSCITAWPTGGTGGGLVATPGFSPGGGTYQGAQLIALTDPTVGSVMYYTIDGSTPTCGVALQYTTPLATLSTGTEVISAIGCETGLTPSSVVSATYTITSSSTVAVPTIAPPTVYIGDVTRATITDATPGASELYCIDTVNLCTPNILYTGQINVTSSEFIRASASGMTTSAVTSWQGIISAQTLTNYSDSLAQANGPLNSNWSQVVGAGCSLTVVSDMAQSSGGACGHNSMDAYTGGTFNNNQYSSMVVGNMTWTPSPVGCDTLVVRSSGQSSYNDCYSGYSNSYALGIVNPSASDFGFAQGTVAPQRGNTIELDVAGVSPVFFWSRVNGTINNCNLDTTYNYIGGTPGFGVIDANTVPTATAGAWSGGSLAAFSTTPTDNFTRANAGWLGDNWWFPWTGDEGGGWQIAGNKAVSAVASFGAWGMAVWTTPLGGSQPSKTTFSAFGSWAGSFTRYTPLATNSDNFYAALANGGQMKLYARVNGSFNLLSSWAYTPTANDTVEIDATGTNPVALTVKVNGASVGTFSDSVYHIAGQYAGFMALGSGTTVSNWAGQ